jgi:hypothetical protein
MVNTDGALKKSLLLIEGYFVIKFRATKENETKLALNALQKWSILSSLENVNNLRSG